MRHSSTKAFGGPANINGILYQVLRTLKKVASYSLSATTTQPLLIAEPIGGDLRVETSAVREVWQFKTKAKEGTWSLATVIDEVLPDLYLAVDASGGRPSRYLFVTDGRLGTSAKALEFFRDLRQRKPEVGHELGALDDVQKVKFSREYSATEQELFLRVVKSVRSRTKARRELRATTITKVWHLLASFDLEALQTKEDADAEITRLLRELGVAPNDVGVRRAALIGFLTELSTKGNALFTPQELLKKAQLRGVPLSQYAELAASSRALFVDDIGRAGYTSSTRLDRPLSIPVNTRCICFAGDSGQGKSWAMAAEAERVSREYEHLVVYIRATGDATRDFAESVEKISREVLLRSEASSLRSLALDVNELLPADDRPWLTICIDDVQSAQEAEGLLVADREHDRVRVVFTAPSGIASSLRGREHLTVVDVWDFTTLELREYLDRHGWVWGAVPSDIRRVIHRPLLARLFVDVAGDPTWRGITEYSLYEKYWARLTMGGQGDYPQDAVLQPKGSQLLTSLFRMAVYMSWNGIPFRGGPGAPFSTISRIPRVRGALRLGLAIDPALELPRTAMACRNQRLALGDPWSLTPLEGHVDERARSRTEAHPSSFIVRTMPERRMSMARATPATPAAPSAASIIRRVCALHDDCD